MTGGPSASRGRIVLAGAGGHARSCIDVIEREERFAIAGLLGRPAEVGAHVLGYPILGTDDDLGRLAEWADSAIVAVGQIRSPEARMRVFALLRQAGLALPAIVSPRAVVSRHASLGAGTIVMHGAIVNAGAVVGDNCIVNSGALVEHDAVIGDHCHVATAATVNGGVSVGAGTFIGSASVVREGVTIGERCVIGMGARIMASCEAGALRTSRDVGGEA